MLPGQLELPQMEKRTLIPPEIRRSAHIVGDRRYILTRVWRAGPHVCFIGLNPSTADGIVDDPTVRRWTMFAWRWGYGGFVAVNLFPFRTSSPKEARNFAEYQKNGPDWYARDAILHNAKIVTEEAKRASLVVACWGAANWDPEMADQITESITSGVEPWPDIHVFGLTKGGVPIHPMARGIHRIPADAEPVLWQKGHEDAQGTLA